MMDSFTNLDDINREILKYININEIINFVNINNKTKVLLCEVLPELIQGSFDGENWEDDNMIMENLKYITIELLERNELRVTKIIVSEIDKLYPRNDFYSSIFDEVYNYNTLQNLLRIEPINLDWSRIYNDIDNKIALMGNGYLKLKEFLLHLTTSALIVKSISLLIKIIELYDHLKISIIRGKFKEERTKAYQEIIFPELNPLIKKAKMIVAIEGLISSLNDYNLDSMDDIVNRLQTISL